MPLAYKNENDYQWVVRKICVIGPGIVGMPMAALLANSRIRQGTDAPAKVLVLQRNSRTSGWKVQAINEGRSVIGGIEPGLDRIVENCVKEGILSASSDSADAADSDVVLVCVQTDKKGFEPDYGPLLDALEHLASALQRKPSGNIPIVVFESTLAPSTMESLIRPFFAERGLVEGRDVLLGNSPNRVMPGRLVERVASADKLVAGLHPLTAKLIAMLYGHIVTKGTLHQTNSMTAEVVKTLENAYRDVRIAFASEIVRYCDSKNIDFFAVRDAVNERLAQTDLASNDATAVPSGGVLVPLIGVGGHCLPKDGILLWWRMIESRADTSRSLILESRKINDEAPAEAVRLGERAFGPVDGKRVALLGAAYRFDSEDTRNSPTLYLARLLLDRGCTVTIHDPYVKKDDQNLERFKLTSCFTNDLEEAVLDAELIFFCTGHAEYKDGLEEILAKAKNVRGVVDGANLYRAEQFASKRVGYTGIGRGANPPSKALVDFVESSFRVVEHGVANEVARLAKFLNNEYARDDFNKVDFQRVRDLAGTCATGCAIVATREGLVAPKLDGYSSHLAECAAAARG